MPLLSRGTGDAGHHTAGRTALHRRGIHGPVRDGSTAAARRIEHELSITVSGGLSCNRFLVRIAPDLDQPHGFAAIGQAEARYVLAGKPVGPLWGAGKVMRKRLARNGITLFV